MISACILALQVTLTRIFSIMIWYHFTYLIVGVALLGGGASGIFLALRQWDTPTIAKHIGKSALSFSLSILVCLAAITFIQIDPLAINRIAVLQTMVGLAVYFTTVFASFFFGGLTVASAFRVWAKDAHRLYFADLIGASVSTLTILFFIRYLTGPGAIVFISMLAMLAGLLLGAELSRRWKQLMVMATMSQIAILIVAAFVNPIELPVPGSKELNWVQDNYGVDVEYTRWNPVARVDVLTPTQLPYYFILGGVSPLYWEQEHEGHDTLQVRFVTLDGTSITALHEFDGDLRSIDFLKYTIVNAPTR